MQICSYGFLNVIRRSIQRNNVPGWRWVHCMHTAIFSTFFFGYRD